MVIQIATADVSSARDSTWATRLVIALVLLGFPIARDLRGEFELTPARIRRTEDLAPASRYRAGPDARSPSLLRAALKRSRVAGVSIIPTIDECDRGTSRSPSRCCRFRT